MYIYINIRPFILAVRKLRRASCSHSHICLDCKCSISIFGKFNLYTAIKSNIYIEATDILDMHYVATTSPEKSTRTYIQSIDRESSPYGLFHQKYRSTTDNACYGIWMSAMSYINVLRHHHDRFFTLARLPKWQPTLQRSMGYAVSLSY